MEALAVDAQLLRAVLTPEINLSVGRELMARVAALAAEGHGTLSLAGVLLEAELPAGLQAGQEIRLQVREVTPERIVLTLQHDLAQPPPAIGAPLPGGGSVQVTQQDKKAGEREAGSGSSGDSGSSDVHALAITYDAPRLGPVEMKFALDPQSLHLGLTLAAGLPYELAEESSGQLERALSSAVGRTVTISIQPRYDPLDVYA